ncbi:hypothetical protein EIP91_010174 [Steccherinum ochraceum]|uniref:SAP domain-containing protein n=1 Tax=Steccherinum ochraceum TaxID=92696 RepID=A0A4R0RNK1_9APHY|nr:hypothetical protein EIP91_010174 [Steccherinum ochraceum]
MMPPKKSATKDEYLILPTPDQTLQQGAPMSSLRTVKVNVGRMTNPQLQEQCYHYNLNKSGNKTDLLERLRKFSIEPAKWRGMFEVHGTKTRRGNLNGKQSTKRRIVEQFGERKRPTEYKSRKASQIRQPRPLTAQEIDTNDYYMNLVLQQSDVSASTGTSSSSASTSVGPEATSSHGNGQGVGSEMEAPGWSARPALRHIETRIDNLESNVQTLRTDLAPLVRLARHINTSRYPTNAANILVNYPHTTEPLPSSSAVIPYTIHMANPNTRPTSPSLRAHQEKPPTIDYI